MMSDDLGHFLNPPSPKSNIIRFLLTPFNMTTDLQYSLQYLPHFARHNERVKVHMCCNDRFISCSYDTTMSSNGLLGGEYSTN